MFTSNALIPYKNYFIYSKMLNDELKELFQKLVKHQNELVCQWFAEGWWLSQGTRLKYC